MDTHEVTNEDQFDYQQRYAEEHGGTDEVDALVEVKVSADDGETWARRTINLGGDIDDSGLEAGEIFQLNVEKYRVLSGDFGLTIESLKKLVSGKKTSKRK